MEAGPSYEESGKFVMSITLRDVSSSSTYTIHWYKNRCDVYAWSLWGSSGYIKLPMLPLDVTIDKFLTYLLFS